MALDLEEITERVLKEAAENVVRNMIGETTLWGGLDSELKDLVKKRAMELLKTPEMEKELKDSLSEWIKRPQAHREVKPKKGYEDE